MRLTGIAAGAFSPTREYPADITKVVKKVALPETINDLGAGIFAGAAYFVEMAVPRQAVEKIKETIKTEKIAKALEGKPEEEIAAVLDALVELIVVKAAAGSAVRVVLQSAVGAEDKAVVGGNVGAGNVPEDESAPEGWGEPTPEPELPPDIADLVTPADPPPDEGGGGPYEDSIVDDPIVEDPAAAEKLAADINALKPESATVNGAEVTIVSGLKIEKGFAVPKGVALDLNAEFILQNGAVLTVNGTIKAGPEAIRLEDGAKVSIDGSGTIYLKGQGNLLRIDGGKDGAKKTLTLDGVTLAGVDNNTSSLVRVMNGGEFVLKSGAISGNTIDGWGGGVSVEGETAVFTMQGGAISNNTASGSEWSGGGGVAVWDAIFTMKDGTISGNTAKAGTWSSGGGVIVSGEAAIFVMQGGVISGNTVTGGDPWGGGVSLTRGGTFTMEGGTIYGQAGRLPAGTDASRANSAQRAGSLYYDLISMARWGMGGTYTKGGESQTGGAEIRGTDDTLIALPPK